MQLLVILGSTTIHVLFMYACGTHRVLCTAPLSPIIIVIALMHREFGGQGVGRDIINSLGHSHPDICVNDGRDKVWGFRFISSFNNHWILRDVDSHPFWSLLGYLESRKGFLGKCIKVNVLEM